MQRKENQATFYKISFFYGPKINFLYVFHQGGVCLKKFVGVFFYFQQGGVH